VGVLSVAEERTFELFVNPSNLDFRAAVALYPACSVARARPGIPTLIHVGAANDCARAIARY